MDLLDRYGISFFEIQLTECKLITNIDFRIFEAHSIFDFVRELSSKLNFVNKERIDSYLTFMDSVYLYCMIADTYEYCSTLICLIVSFIYLSVKNEINLIEYLKQTIKICLNQESISKTTFECYKKFTIERLIDLGVNDSYENRVSDILTSLSES